jgi:hypothetical protein
MEDGLVREVREYLERHRDAFKLGTVCLFVGYGFCCAMVGMGERCWGWG